jgi:hypothetical protein
MSEIGPSLQLARRSDMSGVQVKGKWLTHARYDVIDSLQALDAVAIGGVYLVRITPD